MRCRSLMVAVLRDGGPAETVSYDDWLHGLDEEAQDEVLGPARAGLFRDGASVREFVDASGRTYTVAELRARH